MIRIPVQSGGSSPARSGVVNGFTVVELITVIALLAILSTVALSRSVKPSSFESSVVSGFLVEELRFARLVAVNRQDVAVGLVIIATDDEWQTTVQGDGSAVLRARSIERGSAVLSADGADLNPDDVLSINYDGQGNIISADLQGAGLSTTDGVNLTIAAENSRLLCLYPSGYATRDSCV